MMMGTWQKTLLTLVLGLLLASGGRAAEDEEEVTVTEEVVVSSIHRKRNLEHALSA